jgi:hypothetical protein
MSNTNPTLPDQIASSMVSAKRVRALSDDARNMLLYALIGRMIVLNPEGLTDDIAEAEELDAEMNTEAANDRS